MQKIHIITPVKDSLPIAEKAIERIMTSRCRYPIDYTVYNDNSRPESTLRLMQLAEKWHFNLINISEISNHPSPNYLLVLQIAQQRALEEDAMLLIVESDVLVENDSLERLVDFALRTGPNTGIVAAVTVGRGGDIIFPYQYFRHRGRHTIQTRKHLSFCCSLLCPALLQGYDFHQLDPEKDWYDVFISHQALDMGLNNFLMLDNPVLHRPHSSRPWKRLKYTHPLKYYWLKFTRKKDRI